MPKIHVCSLARLPSVVEDCGASHLVSLNNHDTPVMRPECIAADRHLFLGINDIIEPMDGMVLAGERHVRDFIDFTTGWERGQPMVVHCWAGISRSTAAAFIASCALRPDLDENEIASRLRASSKTASPNRRLVEIADNLLDRRGRMTDAIDRIGRGEFAYEGVPFFLDIGPRQT